MLQISSDGLSNRSFDNLRDYAVRIYGTVFTNNLIAPVMEKLTGSRICCNYTRTLSAYMD